MKYRRIVVKIGTALLTKKDNTLNEDFIKNIVDQLSQLHKNGHEIILVSSGAVAAGRGELTLKKESKNIPFRQVFSAVGQSILMNTYHGFFKKKDITIAQALLTGIDFKNPGSFINMRNTLNLMLGSEVIPIINENDVTAYEEFTIGENDVLKGFLQGMIPFSIAARILLVTVW